MEVYFNSDLGLVTHSCKLSFAPSIIASNHSWRPRFFEQSWGRGVLRSFRSSRLRWKSISIVNFRWSFAPSSSALPLQADLRFCELSFALSSSPSFAPSGSFGRGGSIFQWWVLSIPSLLQAVLRSFITPWSQEVLYSLEQPFAPSSNPSLFWVHSAAVEVYFCSIEQSFATAGSPSLFHVVSAAVEIPSRNPSLLEKFCEQTIAPSSSLDFHGTRFQFWILTSSLLRSFKQCFVPCSPVLVYFLASF